MDDMSRLKGFQEGIKEMERMAAEAEKAGDQATAAEIRETIKGSKEGIQRWLEARGIL